MCDIIGVAPWYDKFYCIICNSFDQIIFIVLGFLSVIYLETIKCFIVGVSIDIQYVNKLCLIALGIVLLINTLYHFFKSDTAVSSSNEYSFV